MTFIGGSAGVVKSTRGIKSAKKTETIPQTEWYALFLEKKKEMTVNRDVTVR
jgi:hypothetical protein